MDSAERFWAFLIATIALTLITLIITVGVSRIKRINAYVNAGYEQVSVLGSYEYRWQKVKP